MRTVWATATDPRLCLPALPAAAIVKSDAIPSFGTPEWEAFIEADSNNFQVWLEAQFVEDKA